MPVPILPQNTDSLNRREHNMQIHTVDYGKLDVSDLASIIQKRSTFQDSIKVSNHEAGILFSLWKNSNSKSSDDIVIVPKEFSNNDILRLKASGLVSGDTEKVKFTPKGKEVIMTFVLSEQNSLSKTSSTKNYEQILAERKSMIRTGLSLGKK